MPAKQYCAIADYGMGNLHSAAKALQHAAPGTDVIITSEPEVLRGAARVVLPGVGAIRDCMAAFAAAGLDDALRETVSAGRPLLAICIGAQMLLESSEENGGVSGLGLLSGQVRRFNTQAPAGDGRQLKVPHMGWNQVRQLLPHPLWAGIADNSRFYFVHSYRADTGAGTAGESCYGGAFASALAAPGIFAVQFHPEKSHKAGLQLLANFLAWDGSA